VKLGHVILEACEWTDMQTHKTRKHKDTLITLLCTLP